MVIEPSEDQTKRIVEDMNRKFQDEGKKITVARLAKKAGAMRGIAGWGDV